MHRRDASSIQASASAARATRTAQVRRRHAGRLLRPRCRHSQPAPASRRSAALHRRPDEVSRDHLLPDEVSASRRRATSSPLRRRSSPRRRTEIEQAKKLIDGQDERASRRPSGGARQPDRLQAVQAEEGDRRSRRPPEATAAAGTTQPTAATATPRSRPIKPAR